MFNKKVNKLIKYVEIMLLIPKITSKPGWEGVRLNTHEVNTIKNYVNNTIT